MQLPAKFFGNNFILQFTAKGENSFNIVQMSVYTSPEISLLSIAGTNNMLLDI